MENNEIDNNEIEVDLVDNTKNEESQRELNNEFVLDEGTKVNISQLLQKVNRILSEDDSISVVSNKKMAHIGATDITNSLIYMNYDELYRLTKEDVAKFITLSKGINYHELAHILYSDISLKRIEEFVWKRGNTSQFNLNNYFSVFNMLEDCRIENLFSADYNRAKYYFSFAAITILAGKHDDKNNLYAFSNYVLLYGRKFLNIDLTPYRKSIEIDNNIIKRAEAIVDEFIISNDIPQKLELAFEMMNILITDAKTKVNNISSSASLNSTRKSGKKDRIKETVDNLKKELKEQEEAGESALTIDMDEDDEGEENEDGEESEGDGDNKDEKDLMDNLDDLENKEKEDKEQEKTHKEKLKEIDEDKNLTPKQKEKAKEKEKEKQEEKKAESMKEKGEYEKKILDKLQELIEDSLENIQTEIHNDMNTLNIIMNKDDFAAYDGEKFIPTELERFEAKKVEQVLKILKGDLNTSLKKFQKCGKFDIQSAMKNEKAQDLKVFAKHELNKIDKSRLGVSILLDTSGSIQDRDYKTEMSATWCLSEALKNTNNKIQVIEFSQACKAIKSFSSEGDWRRHFNSNTNVINPLKMAFNDLLKLKKTQDINNLVCIIVSDGQFDDPDGAIKEIYKLKKAGIYVVWILVSPTIYYRTNDNVTEAMDMYIHLDSFNKLANEIKKLVVTLQKSINMKLVNNTFYNYSCSPSLELKGAKISSEFFFPSCSKLGDNIQGGKL